MSSVVIAGDTSGSVTLQAPAVAGTTVLTLPATSGTVLAPTGGTLTAAQGGTGLTSVGTAGNTLFTTDGSTWSSTAKIVRAASQTTSGSTITFGSIPSWVKRVTFIYSSLVSTTASTVIQLGTSGGLATSGYLGAVMNENTSNNSVGNISNGFSLQNAGTSHGIVTFVNITGNTWVGSGTIGWSNSALIGYLSGTIALSGVLTQLALVGTFTSGTANILYE